MSTQPIGIPTWDLSDRLRKSLRHSAVSVQEMAEYLGVSRNTVGNYLSGRTHPDRRTTRLWAIRTGVPLEWLEEGIIAPSGDDPDGGDVVTPHTRRYADKPAPAAA